MSDKTKAVNLTEDEIKCLIGYHGQDLNDRTMMQEHDNKIDRINYLNKRLKAFKEPDAVEPPKTDVATEQQGSTW